MATLAARLLPLLDLTRLQTDDTEDAIPALCRQARTPFGNVAAVCVYPRFVALVRSQLQGSGIKVATVSNFPAGDQALTTVLAEIQQVIQAGADEIDVVMPYQAYLAGERAYVQDFISQCRAACGSQIILKVILETGVLAHPEIIAAASRDVLLAGADFIKTSTGKTPLGATPEAVKTILTVLRATPYTAGCKVSGGVRTLTQAAVYWQLAQDIMGTDWPTPKTFRIGTSQLLNEIVRYLKQASEQPAG